MSSFEPIGDGGLDALLSPGSGTVVLDFWAPWCTRCAELERTMQSVAPRHAVKIVQINIAEQADIAARERVMSVPALVIFKDGVKVRSVFGSLSETELDAMMGEHA